MKLKFQPDDPHLLQTLIALASGAMESPGANFRIKVGRVTLNCTADTLATQHVQFDAKFLAGTTPFVFVSLSSPSVSSASVTVSSTQENNAGFTAQVMSTQTQVVTVAWFAIGQTG